MKCLLRHNYEPVVDHMKMLFIGEAGVERVENMKSFEAKAQCSKCGDVLGWPYLDTREEGEKVIEEKILPRNKFRIYNQPEYKYRAHLFWGGALIAAAVILETCFKCFFTDSPNTPSLWFYIGVLLLYIGKP